MWAALKSPLLIGNDLRELSAESLTILNNPAIIAISQDPLGRSAIRVSRDTNVAKDKYGMGETQIWSGHLFDGDQVMILFNAANEDVQMTATLEELFYNDGPAGSAPQVHDEWEVYDLWANRMDKATAGRILKAKPDAVEKIFEDVKWYNATALSYKDGLRAGDERLLGKKVGTIPPNGSWTALVKRHSVEIYRLRSGESSHKRYQLYKEEL